MNRSGHAGDSSQLPSKVSNKKFIRMPNVYSVVESDEEWRRCGKWLVFGFEDEHDQDDAWIRLQGLIDDGTLLMIKSSTAKMAEEHGMIICYTRPEKSEVKKAADAIRSKTHTACALLYKTNERTEQYLLEDTVSHQYMYTAGGRFYERDEHDRWILVKDDEEDNNESKQSEEDRGSEKRQSDISLTSVFAANEETFCRTHPDYRNSKMNYWFVSCDFTYRDERGRTEMEKVQTAAEELFERGVFPKIFRMKPKGNHSAFHFYVPECKEERDVLKYVLELRKSVFLPHILCFYEINWRGKHMPKFMHTLEGEFIGSIKRRGGVSYLLKTLSMDGDQ